MGESTEIYEGAGSEGAGGEERDEEKGVKGIDLLYVSAQLARWYTLTGAMMVESRGSSHGAQSEVDTFDSLLNGIQ